MSNPNSNLAPADELESYQWLTQQEAKVWLENLQGEDCTSIAVIERIRKELSQIQVTRLLQQIELCEKAKAKIRDAEKYLYTQRAFEQASSSWIAEYKASKFSTTDSVIDLCSGLGIDSIAIAKQVSSVTAIDQDPIIACIAEANFQAAHLGDKLTMKTEPASVEALRDCTAWHIDPDRRAQGKKTTDLAGYSPSLETIESFLAANPNGVIKLAPGTEIPFAWEENFECEWIAEGNECKQLVIWAGKFVNQSGKKIATRISAGGTGEMHHYASLEDHELKPSSDLKAYVYEPNAAILAARLSGSLAQEFGMSCFSENVPYLWSDEVIDHPFLARFRVLEVLPFDLKKLKRTLKKQSIGKLEIKKRGIELSPENIRKKLKAQGEREATLLIAPCGISKDESQVICAIAQRETQFH